jgi:Uma2 family endonuclease
MTVHTRKMTVDEFLAWVRQQPPGRYELHEGVVVKLQSEFVEHTEVKGAAFVAITAAIQRRACRAERRQVEHYVRGEDGAGVLAGIVASGELELSPPGITIAVAELFAAG